MKNADILRRVIKMTNGTVKETPNAFIERELKVEELREFVSEAGLRNAIVDSKDVFAFIHDRAVNAMVLCANQNNIAKEFSKFVKDFKKDADYCTKLNEDKGFLKIPRYLLMRLEYFEEIFSVIYRLPYDAMYDVYEKANYTPLDRWENKDIEYRKNREEIWDCESSVYDTPKN